MISEARGRVRTGAGGSAGMGSAARVSAGRGAGGEGGAGSVASVDQISAAASNLLAAVGTDVVRASLDSAISVSSVRANYPMVNMTGGKLFRQTHAELRTGNDARVACATHRESSTLLPDSALGSRLQPLDVLAVRVEHEKRQHDEQR